MELGPIMAELQSVFTADWWKVNWLPLLNVMMIDLVLAGDNAIIVGLAASRVAKHMRARVIFWGIAGAVILRILFASVTMQLLAIVGLTLAGGILLLWVCWKMYRQITSDNEHDLETVEKGLEAESTSGPEMGFWPALMTIIVADVSMSLDNVLAVAGAAKGSPLVLVIGLAVAIILMAVASHFIASLLVKYPWITWIGLVIILWVALEMVYKGSHEVTCKIYDFGCSETLLQGIMNRIGLR